MEFTTITIIIIICLIIGFVLFLVLVWKPWDAKSSTEEITNSSTEEKTNENLDELVEGSDTPELTSAPKSENAYYKLVISPK